MVAPVRRLACLLALTASACTTAKYWELRPEAEIEELAPLKAATDALPRSRALVPTAERGEGSPRVAIHELGRGDRGRVVVLVHGVLSDHRTWRFLAGQLAGDEQDLWLVDLPGCGESDPVDLDEPECLGASNIARRLLAALRIRLAQRRPPARLVLVGHSYGGTVALRMMAEPLRSEFADVVSRVDRQVLLAPLDVALERVPASFREIARVSALEVGLGSLLGSVRERVATSVHDFAADPRTMPREEVDRLVEILCDGPRRRASQAMLCQAVPWRDDERPDWSRIEPIVRDYGAVAVPTLVLWGARDETLPLSMGYKLAAEIPHARLRVIPRATHSLQIEEPRLCAEAIREFLGAGEKTGVSAAP